MLRFLPVLLALIVGLLLILGLLLVFKSPEWSYWPLALLAGEFGHWLAPFAFLGAVVAWKIRGPHLGFFGMVAVVGILAGLLLLKPIWQARGVGRGLAARLTQNFGGVTGQGEAFAIRGLIGTKPMPVASRTLNYAQDLSLDFYPAVGRSPAPCVVVVHGGGWNSGERGEFPQFNHWLAGRGYAVAAISYRLAPKFPWPAQRDDITAAVDFLRSQASALGIDPARFVLLGRSAGGNLAEATAYGRRDPSIRGVVALYSPADLYFAWEFSREDDVLKSPQLLRDFLGGTPETARANYDSASPIRFVDKNTLPTLLIHGQLDTLVWHRQSERLDQKLTEAGVPHVFVSLPWATHAFDYNLNGPGGQITRYSVDWFLRAVTK